MKKVIGILCILLFFVSCSFHDKETELGTVKEIIEASNNLVYTTTIILDTNQIIELSGRWEEIKVGMCIDQIQGDFNKTAYSFRECRKK